MITGFCLGLAFLISYLLLGFAIAVIGSYLHSTFAEAVEEQVVAAIIFWPLLLCLSFFHLFIPFLEKTTKRVYQFCMRK